VTKQRRKKHSSGLLGRWLSVAALLLVAVVCFAAVRIVEDRMTVEIENAGMQMTAHTNSRSNAQIFMNENWHAKRNTETLLVMGVDNYGPLTEADAYNTGRQTDFLVLFLRDVDTGRASAIHLNRDTMTDITTLGVTGEPTGTMNAQLALAYNYGDGGVQSSSNVVSAVEHLLYGIEIDHYITVTMDAVPIMNDWAGGVAVEVLDDFTSIDSGLVQGELVKLDGKQALAYVRTRKGLDDSSNLHRMERQRQYASEWIKSAREKLGDRQAVVNLARQLDGYYQSNCTIDQLAAYAQSLSDNPSMPVYETEGTAEQGEIYMEYHVDEYALQQMVLQLFYAPVEM